MLFETLGVVGVSVVFVLSVLVGTVFVRVIVVDSVLLDCAVVDGIMFADGTHVLFEK